MGKAYTINDITYTITPCTAIAGCDNYDENYRQDALLITSWYGGEKVEDVVFGFDMPETLEDFVAMSEDSAAWESYYETLETVILGVGRA